MEIMFPETPKQKQVKAPLIFPPGFSVFCTKERNKKSLQGYMCCIKIRFSLCWLLVKCSQSHKSYNSFMDAFTMRTVMEKKKEGKTTGHRTARINGYTHRS